MVKGTDKGIEKLAQFAKDVVIKSGEKALSYYGKGKSNIKFDEGLVTEAELQLTEFFQDQLNANFPGHQIFSNNRKNTEYTHKGDKSIWIFDPLDGVANFQAGIPIWSISISLIENFWPIFGLVYMPVTGDLFHAKAENQAYWGDRSVRISTQEDINDESLLLTYSRFQHHYRSAFPGKTRDFGCTSAHICYVAMGRAEAAVIANESYQDLSAASIILEASGGKIFKMDGSEFYLNEYLDSDIIDEHLLVASPETYLQVRGFLEKNS